MRRHLCFVSLLGGTGLIWVSGPSFIDQLEHILPAFFFFVEDETQLWHPPQLQMLSISPLNIRG